LHSTWSAPRRGAGVDAISVTADDFRTWVFAQPVDQRISRRVLEQVNDLMGVCVDQYGAVAAPATESEFVDPKAARRRKRRFR